VYILFGVYFSLRPSKMCILLLVFSCSDTQTFVLNNNVYVYLVTQIRISCSDMLFVSCLYYRSSYRYAIICAVQ